MDSVYIILIQGSYVGSGDETIGVLGGDSNLMNRKIFSMC